MGHMSGAALEDALRQKDSQLSLVAETESFLY